MPFQLGQSGNPCGRPKGSRNKNSLAAREWAAGIVEDPKVQARLLADARTGKLHPSVMTALMAYAYGKPRDDTSSEPMIPLSEIEDARQSLEIKLQRIRESRSARRGTNSISAESPNLRMRRDGP